MTDTPRPDETERDVPGIDSAIDAAAKALANWHCVEYRYASGKAQAKWRIQAEVAVRAWQEDQRRTAEESVPESHRAEREAADELARLGQEMRLDEATPAVTVEDALKELRILTRCPSSKCVQNGRHHPECNKDWRPEVEIVATEIERLTRELSTLRAELNAECEDWVNPVEHARVKYELKDARAEVDKYRRSASDAAVELGVNRTWDQARRDALHAAWAERDRLRAELAELKAGRAVGATGNRRENADHNAVMTGVATALDREGLTYEQIELVTDACLTYVENHHGLCCPGEMCPNSYRGDGAERALIEHYLRVHSEAAVEYMRAHRVDRSVRLDELVRHAEEHGLYEATAEPVDARPTVDTSEGWDGHVGAEQQHWAAEVRASILPSGSTPAPTTHPLSEACVHCASPARLASVDPVVDCAREECPNVDVLTSPKPGENFDIPAPTSCPGCRTVAPASHAQGCSHAPDGAREILRRLIELVDEPNHEVLGSQRYQNEWLATWTEARALLAGESP